MSVASYAASASNFALSNGPIPTFEKKVFKISTC